MAEVSEMDGPNGTGIGMTLVGVAALMGIAYVSDRIYRRWLRENHPLAEHRARIVRMSTGYRRKRAGLKELIDIVDDVLIEVARASSKSR